MIEDLKKVAPKLGFSGYQPLIRAYVGQGLRKDLARLERDSAEALTASLRRRGVADEVIQKAIAEAGLEGGGSWNKLVITPGGGDDFQGERAFG